MSLQEDFDAAVVRVKKLSQTPSQGELLQLYALYKQATEGDASGKRPGITKVRERAKFDAWSKNAGLDKDGAMQRYIELVGQLESR